MQIYTHAPHFTVIIGWIHWRTGGNPRAPEIVDALTFFGLALPEASEAAQNYLFWRTLTKHVTVRHFDIGYYWICGPGCSLKIWMHFFSYILVILWHCYVSVIDKCMMLITIRARRKRMREAFGIVDHNDGMSTDDEQNNLETSKFNSRRGLYFTLSHSHQLVGSTCVCVIYVCSSSNLIHSNLFDYNCCKL